MIMVFIWLPDTEKDLDKECFVDVSMYFHDKEYLWWRAYEEQGQNIRIIYTIGVNRDIKHVS